MSAREVRQGELKLSKFGLAAGPATRKVEGQGMIVFFARACSIGLFGPKHILSVVVVY